MTLPAKINVGNGEAVHLRESTGECEVHDLPATGLGRVLIRRMRASYPTGINVCVPCIERAKQDVRPR